MTVFRSMLILSALALLSACGQTPVANTPSANNSPSSANAASPSPAASIDTMAQGRKLYMDNCAICHKEKGTGGKIEIEGKSIDPDDLTSDKIKSFSDDKIYGYIYRGIEDEGMPSFKDKLSEAEIREVVRYLRSDIQKLADTKKAPANAAD